MIVYRRIELPVEAQFWLTVLVVLFAALYMIEYFWKRIRS